MVLARAVSTLIILAAIFMSGCSNHAFVSASAGEDIRDVELPSGALDFIPAAGGSSIVGLAYDMHRDRLYARIAPGNQVQEIDRRTGGVLRTFPARLVTPGCGQVRLRVEIPAVTCGLAIRLRDKHLFLDHPVGNPITEIDINGNWVRNITLQRPDGVIGGLAYDQRKNTIYVLYVTTLTVAEVDLDGNELRRFQPQGTIQPEGLSINALGNALYIPLVNGIELGVFDLSGALIDRHPLQRAAGLAGGVGAGSRRTFR